MKFKVRPQGPVLTPFPIDMLRFDFCWPKTENDSAKILATFYPGRYKSAIIENGIELLAEKTKPTEDRWESFGWEVVK